jgi:predicted  nucleic acid-binding Zn-ribbon protein
MQQLTIRVADETAAAIEERADGSGASKSEVARELLRLGTEYESLQTECDRLRRQLQATNARQDDVSELVEYVEEERAIQRRREERQHANVLRRAWWWVAGTPEDTDA